jgi:GntR family transcriptional regulator
VQKAYRELELAGLVAGRPGQGTYVQRSLAQSNPAALTLLGRRLDRWITSARAAGLDDEGIVDVFETTLRRGSDEAIA